VIICYSSLLSNIEETTPVTFEIWLAFTLASTAVVLIPGPNIILTINYAIRDGKRTGLATVPGVVAGAFVAMSSSLAGAGAILAASSSLFSILKFAGAAYLIWLALKLWNAPTDQVISSERPEGKSLRIVFYQSFLISVLNPKGPIFYMAFVPQFLNTAEPVFLQFVILIVTFLAVATLNSLLWLTFASSMRVRFQNPAMMRIVNRVGATCLGIAGIFTARASRMS
jgi:threonine/homoserine/homoserine lactone efflux protein